MDEDADKEILIQTKLYQGDCGDISKLLNASHTNTINHSTASIQSLNCTQLRQLLNQLTCQFAATKDILYRDNFTQTLTTLLQHIASLLPSSSTTHAPFYAQLVYSTSALLIRCNKNNVVKLALFSISETQVSEKCTFAALLVQHTLVLSQLYAREKIPVRTQKRVGLLIHQCVKDKDIMQRRSRRELVLTAVVLQLCQLLQEERVNELKALFHSVQQWFDLPNINRRYRRLTCIIKGICDFKQGEFSAALTTFAAVDSKQDKHYTRAAMLSSEAHRGQRSYGLSLSSLQQALCPTKDRAIQRLIVQNILKLLHQAEMAEKAAHSPYGSVQERFFRLLLKSQSEHNPPVSSPLLDADPVVVFQFDKQPPSRMCPLLWSRIDVMAILAKSLLDRREYEAALKALEPSSVSKDPHCLLQKSLALVCLKRLDEAEVLLHSVSSDSKPKGVSYAQLLLADIHFEAARYTDAMRILSSLITTSTDSDGPVRSVAAHNLALLTYCGFDRSVNLCQEETLKLLEHAHKLNRSNTLAAYETVVLCLAAGDTERACKAWRQLSSSPDSKSCNNVREEKGDGLTMTTVASSNTLSSVPEGEKEAVKECILLLGC